MTRKFDNGIMAVISSFDVTAQSNLTLVAGDKITFEVVNTLPTIPVNIFKWEYVITAADVTAYSGHKLQYLLDGLQTYATNNSMKMPYLYKEPGTYCLITWLFDLVDLDYTVYNLEGTWKLNTTSIQSGLLNFYNLDAGSPAVLISEESTDKLPTFLAGSLVGYFVNQALTNEQALAINA